MSVLVKKNLESIENAKNKSLKENNYVLVGKNTETSCIPFL